MGKARGFEEFQTGHVTTGHTTVYLIQAQGFETIIQHELNRRAGIALFAVFHIVNHDSQAGPLVIRVEIVQVDQSDGLLGIDTCNHQPQLLAGINVYMGIFNVFFQCEMREWGQGVTDIPKVHIVFPLVEVLQIFGFECPDQNVFILHHKFCHLFYGQYSYL